MHTKLDDPRPLAGIRVFDLGIAIAGPLSARYLAHFGAEVIKLETREHTDTSRSFGCSWLSPDKYGHGVWADTSPNINDNSSGKKCIGLNLKAPEGLAAAKRLLAKCDVFVSNFTPRAIRSLGLDYEAVRAVKPDIVYVHATGYGVSGGPYASYMAWGKNLVAITGIDALTGWPDRPPAGINGIAYPDHSNALYGLTATLAALDYRKRTGQGGFVDISEFEATVALMGPQMLDYMANGHCPDRMGNRHPWAAPHGVYPCRGKDRWVAIAAFTEEEWQSFCLVTDHPEWTADPRFEGLRERLAHADELDELVAEWTSRHTDVEVSEWLQREGVAAAPVLDYAGLIMDPQLASRGFWLLPDSARFGKDLSTGFAIHMSDTPGYVKRAGPALGEHNDYVLGEICGYSADEITGMVEKGIVYPMASPEVKLERPWFEWLKHFTPLLPWDGPEGTAVPTAQPARPSESEIVPRKERTDTSALLAGYRVLDLAGESGVYGTKLLADLGAEVIRIEPPQGDPTRSLPPFFHDRPGPERSLYFAYMNTNKRSVTLDLDSAEGQDLFKELAKRADAVVETFAPGYMSERGIGYQELSELNPNLVWAALTPFGQSGPRRDWKGSDLIAWAVSGLLYITGDPDRPPAKPAGPASLAYGYGGLNAVAGVLLALRARQRIGHGQYIDISMQEACIAPQGNTATFLDDLVQRMRTGSTRPLSSSNSVYACEDGYAAVLNQLPLHWQRFAQWTKEVTGIEEIVNPAYNNRRYRTHEKLLEVDEWSETLTRRYTKQTLFEEGQGRGIGVTPVNTIADLADDPHLEARKYWAEMAHPTIGKLRMPGPPFRFTQAPWQAGQPPLLGQDNGAIYSGELGLSASDLAVLRANGVI